MVLVNDNADSRRMVEWCYKRHKTSVNPIIDWENSDVWQFIRSEHIPYCCLYDEGWHRLGCIGCPMSRPRERERSFLRWPKYKEQYMRTLDKMIDRRTEAGKGGWTRNAETTAQDIFNWWMEYDVLPGQIDLLEEGKGDA